MKTLPELVADDLKQMGYKNFIGAQAYWMLLSADEKNMITEFFLHLKGFKIRNIIEDANRKAVKKLRSRFYRSRFSEEHDFSRKEEMRNYVHGLSRDERKKLDSFLGLLLIRPVSALLKNRKKNS